MKFLIYSILTDKNSNYLEGFMQQLNEIKLPIKIAIFDSRKKKFDVNRKLIKKGLKNDFIYIKSSSENDAHIGAIMTSQNHFISNMVFLDLKLKFDEISLTTLIVRSNDLNAIVCPVSYQRKFVLFRSKI
jgi:hypothetical protein